MTDGFLHSETVGELAQALSKAQGEIANAAKNAANPFFHSKYADLASVMDVIRAPFTKHGSLCREKEKAAR